MKAMFNGKPIFGPRGPAGPDGNPIGTVTSYMGVKAPEDYLVCDGAEYSIVDYPKLAEFFQEQFGAVNYFGGDGETTFAVPDIRNLFLRGYHGEAEEQLTGDIGVKQDGTEFPYISTYGSSSGAVLQSVVTNPLLNAEPKNEDIKTISTENAYYRNYSPNDQGQGSIKKEVRYSSRPVNMAVLYCIKAVVSVPYEDIYSTEETVIGRWIDGKPVYQKVLVDDTVRLLGPDVWTKLFDLSGINIKNLISFDGFYIQKSDDAVKPIPSDQLWLRFYTDGWIWRNGSYAVELKTICIIVKYTKTTDQGGVSG